MARANLRIKPVDWHPRYRYTIGGLKVNGKRKRLFFETEEDAKDELRRLKIKERAGGEAGLSIPDELRVAALECTKRLATHGKTIYDATEFFLKYLETSRSAKASVYLQRYIAQKKKAGLSGRHLYDIEKRLKSFGEAFGDSPIQTITASQIEDWLYTLGDAEGGEFSARTLINWRATVHAFFEDLFKKRILFGNPVSAIQKPKHVSGSPSVFTPQDLEKILVGATGPLRACLAIQAFAGLRTAEVLRLRWEDVRQSEKLIHVGAQIAKASKRRLVKILPNLAEWLRPFARARGKIWPTGFRSDIADVCSTVKVAWKHNGLRHSFGSYHLAKFQNADALAEEMGHISGRMVRDYYREVVTPQSAELYWLIQPKKQAGNIVAMEESAAA
jgi:integrase